MTIAKGGDLNTLIKRVKSEFLYVATIVFIVLYVFRGYFLGNTAPPWDFYGDYYTQAFSWWDLGSFFHPTTYLPYLISGYPSHLGLQVSSYYLPVGIVAEFFGYTLENAVRLQGLTILFGIVGTYLLARLQLFSKPTSVLMGLTYLFSAGFFSNASHIDIVRAWAFFPWLLISLKPIEKLRSWQILFASVLWFQFFVGSYPGNIASFFYAFLAWIIINLYINREKLKVSLVFYTLTIGIGTLLSMPKYLPFLLTGSGPKIQNQVIVDLGIVSTLFFPYGGTGQSGDIILPNDLTQRTFYIIPLAVLIAFFANRKNINYVIGTTFISLAVILGIDTAIFPHWQENLPLLDISRFRTIDFKPVIVMGLSFLTWLGYERILAKKDYKLYLIIPRFIVAIGFATIVVFFAKISDLINSDIQFGLYWLIYSITILFVMLLVRIRLLVNLIAMASFFIIGLSWAGYFINPWNENRINTEKLYFGDLSNNIIESQNEKVLVSRPARVGPEFPIPYPGEMIIQFWNSNELKRVFTTGGYVTIKGEKTFQSYVETALDPGSQEIMNFISKESAAIFFETSIADIDACLVKNDCKKINAEYEYTQWQPGEITIKVTNLNEPAQIIINEVNWPGWKYEVCDVKGICIKEMVSQNSDQILLSAALKENDLTIRFFFETPGMKYAWTLFYAGIILLLMAMQINTNSRIRPIKSGNK